MIQRIRDAIRRWWHSSHGRHARPWGDDFEFFTTLDITQATIPRKPTLGRPPWPPAQRPAVCLFPLSTAA